MLRHVKLHVVQLVIYYLAAYFDDRILRYFQHLQDITGYIAFIKHQPLNAISIGDRIFETIDRIEQNHLAFREHEEIPAFVHGLVGLKGFTLICMCFWL